MVEPAEPPLAELGRGDGGTELDWRRPHPITILVEIGRALRSLVVAVAVVSGGFLDQSSLLEIALIAGPLVGALARWFTTRYAIDEESVHHHHGLIWRSRQVLPRANIQNVSTRAGLLARVTSVVELQISDASATGDITIRYLRSDEADRLATLLRADAARSVAAPVTTPEGDPKGDREEGTAQPGEPGSERAPDVRSAWPEPVGRPIEVQGPLVATSGGRLLWSEITATPVLALAVTGVAAMVVGFLVVAPVGETGLGMAALISVAGLAGPLIGAAAIVIGRFVTVGGFRLFADPDRLRIQVGLLTEARITARRERIQQIRVERQLLHRRLGIERVAYETADLESDSTLGTGYLDPVADRGAWPALAREVFGACDLGEDDLRPVSPLAARRTFVRLSLAVIPIAAIALGLVPLLGWWTIAAGGLVIAAWLPVAWWYGRQRARRLGWAMSADQYLVRSGVFTTVLRLVRVDKVQALWLVASPFQRRLDLATVLVSTAGRGFGGLVRLPDLPRPEAEALLDRLAHRAAETSIADTL